LFITKKFLIDCKNPIYFSKKFSLEVTVQISSQNLFELCCKQIWKTWFWEKCV